MPVAVGLGHVGKARCLKREDVRVVPPRHQIIEGAFLDDEAVVDHDDVVSAANG